MDGIGGQLHTLLCGGCMCKMNGVEEQLHTLLCGGCMCKMDGVGGTVACTYFCVCVPRRLFYVAQQRIAVT
jgi:hypothetical protein